VRGKNGTPVRRSSRVTLRIRMQVCESGAGKSLAVEDTHSVKVSLWGGLVTLKSTVYEGQKLVVVNRITRASQEARVVYLGPVQMGGRLVGFEFLEAAPDFWGLVFPMVGRQRSSSKPTYARGFGPVV
jgi:hypothetical protein